MNTTSKKIANLDTNIIEFIENNSNRSISLIKAKELFKILTQQNEYSDLKKNTMKYIRKHYSFTKEADVWIRKEIRSWVAKNSFKKKLLDKKNNQVIDTSNSLQNKITDDEKKLLFYPSPSNTNSSVESSISNYLFVFLSGFILGILITFLFV